MAIYGLCPKTEMFELVVCNYCGLKYKLPAFAEHISLRHSGDKKSGTSCIEKPTTPKKGKLKKPKEKFKIKAESLTVKVDMNMKIDFLEIVSDRQSLTIDSETVSKLKQLHVNSKTFIKNSEYNVLNNEESYKVNESVLIKDTPSHKLIGANDIKRHDVSSPVSQDDEIINMQPIVKLSPIHSNPNVSKSNSLDKTDLKRIHLDNEPKKSIPYSPGTHCEILDSEIEPCIQNLDSKVHSTSSKKVVADRSRLYDANSTLEKDTLKEKNEKTSKKPRFEVSVLSSGLSKADNKNVTVLKYHKTVDMIRAPVIGNIFNKESTAGSRKQFDSFSEEDVSSSRPSKRSSNDLHGLSLPVSIKNPSILCQLQNFKSKFYSPVKTARFTNIHEILKGNLAPKNMKVELNSQACKENTESVIIELEGTPKTPAVKSSELKLEWFQQWHPGYRRVGGLLYTNHNITYVRRQTFITAVSSFSQEEHYNSLLQQRLNAIRDKNEVIDLCDNDTTKTEFKRVKFETSTGNNKKPINSVISKQKNNFIITSNVSKSCSISSKLQINQPTNNKAFVCKRSSNNINGALPAKIKRQDGMVNIITPVFRKINKTCL
ncbi:uncharacterized protein [Halyomorpha halys]